MTIGDSTQLLSKEASVELLADMLKQAEEDKKALLEALKDARDKLEIDKPAGAARVLRDAIEKAESNHE